MSLEPEYAWTQPICPVCYDLRHPGRLPIKIIDRELEYCVDCGKQTGSGIYIRTDPKTARYPTLEK